MAETHAQEPVPVALYVQDSGNSEDSITAQLDIQKEFARKNGMEPAVSTSTGTKAERHSTE